eukprot:519291_1
MGMPEIEFLVLDEFKTVSYKWLSQDFGVSANSAKKLLADFVLKKGDEVNTRYLLSGLEKSTGNHVVKQVYDSKLEAAKSNLAQLFSLHIYSVEPKARVKLNSEEKEGAEILKSANTLLSGADHGKLQNLFEEKDIMRANPLRDGRFSGIKNPTIHRSAPVSLSEKASGSSGSSSGVRVEAKKPKPASSQPSKSKVPKVVKKAPKIIKKGLKIVETAPEKVKNAEKATGSKSKFFAQKSAGGGTSKKGAGLQASQESTSTVASSEDTKNGTNLARGFAKLFGAAAKSKPKKKKKEEVAVEEKENVNKNGETDESKSPEPVASKSSHTMATKPKRAKKRKIAAKPKKRVKKAKIQKPKEPITFDESSGDESHASACLSLSDASEESEDEELKRAHRRAQAVADEKKKKEKAIKKAKTSPKKSKKTPKKPGKSSPKKPERKRKRIVSDDEDEEADSSGSEQEDDRRRKNFFGKDTQILAGPQRLKKRMKKTRTYMNDQGYFVTEDVEEIVSGDEIPTVVPKPKKSKIQKEPKIAEKTPKIGPPPAKKKSVQTGIAGFFSKK